MLEALLPQPISTLPVILRRCQMHGCDAACAFPAAPVTARNDDSPAAVPAAVATVAG